MTSNHGFHMNGYDGARWGNTGGCLCVHGGMLPGVPFKKELAIWLQEVQLADKLQPLAPSGTASAFVLKLHFLQAAVSQ